MQKKNLWIIVGGNGAGKTTFFEKVINKSGSVPFVNADLIAKYTFGEDAEKRSYDASKIAEERRYQYIKDGKSFCFETVFSHSSKIDFISEAKANGYKIIMFFIHLERDDLNKARVSQRVEEGGHSVPENKISSRIPRTLSNVKKSMPLLDELYVYENSSAEKPFEPMLSVIYNEIQFIVDKKPTWLIPFIS